MIVTAHHLRQFNPRLQPGLAAIYADAIDGVLVSAAIDRRMVRVRHFMAQLAHESGGFRGLTESLAYRDPTHLLTVFSAVQTPAHAQHLIAEGPEAIGNCVYANKLGNGTAATGDGFRFRGRGFIMNTGRANYAGVQQRTGHPTVDQPDMLGMPEVAAEAAAMFWTTRKINLAADQNDIEAVSRLVNGRAMQGLADRKTRLALAEQIWPDP